MVHGCAHSWEHWAQCCPVILKSPVRLGVVRSGLAEDKSVDFAVVPSGGHSCG